MKFNRSTVICSLITVFVLAAAGAGAFSAWQSFQDSDRIAHGITAEGVKLGGLTQAEATDALEKALRKKLNRNAILLSYQKQAWRVAPEEIELVARPGEAAAAAFSVCRSGDWYRDINDAFDCFTKGKKLTVPTSCNTEKVKKLLDKLAKKIDCQGSDASCSIGPNGSVLKKKAVTGRRTDTAALTDHLVPSLLALRLPRRIEIEPDIEDPAVTDNDIKEIDKVLAEYTTYFNGYTDRGENVRLAAAALNHYLLKPGQEFSFNKVVGERSAEAGYLTAPVIIDGRTEPGLGGGVCQVSSTLYNAILLAGLTPTSRSPHFFPAAYVPEGLDATVAYNELDFCFKNTLPHNVYFLTYADGNELTVRVLGTSADLGGLDISVDSYYNEDGAVESWRIYSDHGKEIRREHLFTDEYEPPKPPLEEVKPNAVQKIVPRTLVPKPVQNDRKRLAADNRREGRQN